MMIKKTFVLTAVLLTVCFNLFSQTAEEWKKLGNIAFEKAAQLGDTLAQQFLADEETSWKSNFISPDYKLIKKNIENKKSNFYYPILWDRFQQGDTTLTLEEKRHLYYGYLFHKNYASHASSHDAKQVNEILNKENPTKKEWEKLVSLLNTSLTTEPFCGKYIFFQGIAYDALNKKVEAKIQFQKVQIIIDALLSTGNGLTKETAIHVISISNEYDHLFFNELSIRSQSLTSDYFDVLRLEPNEYGFEEMWFDVKQLFKSPWK